MPKHPELADRMLPNLPVMKAMQSLKSRGYAEGTGAWRHFWYLTNEASSISRDYLHLPPEIVPATLRRSHPETGRTAQGLEESGLQDSMRGGGRQRHIQTSAVPLVPTKLRPELGQQLNSV